MVGEGGTRLLLRIGLMLAVLVASGCGGEAQSVADRVGTGGATAGPALDVTNVPPSVGAATSPTGTASAAVGATTPPVETVETDEPMPPEVEATPWVAGSAAEVLQNDPRFATLIRLLGEGGVLHIIADTGPFTVFAPTEVAWSGVAEDSLSGWVTDPITVQDFLLSHVVEGRLTQAELLNMGAVIAVSGQEIAVSGSEGALVVNGTINVLEAIDAVNGVVYVIDGLIYTPGT